MDGTLNSNDFRQQLGDRLKKLADTGEPTTVSRYNVPVAVLVPADWYARAVAAIGAPGPKDV
jgi:prevent-host-death family protein